MVLHAGYLALQLGAANNGGRCIAITKKKNGGEYYCKRVTYYIVYTPYIQILR